MKTGSSSVHSAQFTVIRQLLLLFTVHCSLFTLARAADFQVSASLDRNQIAMNEQVVLSLTISGSSNDLPQPQLPGLTDFQIYNAGRSQNFTWINGKASAIVTYNYVLTPMKEGHYTIPAIRVQAQGQAVETAPLPLDVVKGDASAVQGSARPEGESRPAPAAHGPPAVFITGSVDKSSVYVGEPVTFTFRLYHRVPLMSRPNYQPPEMSGFWTEDLPPQRNFAENVRGMPYNVVEVRTALFPSTSGKARIGSANLTVNLENFGTDPFGSDFFAQFFGRGEEKILRTDPIMISVKPLPEPKPAEFKGAVGDYALDAQVDKKIISVGQPITLTLTVSGHGNIKSLPDLTVPPLTNFRTFDANAATNIDKKDGQVSGSKVFKTVLIPTASGELTIPPVSFAYFDTNSRDYRHVRSHPIVIHVTPGTGAPQPAMGMGETSPGSQAPAAAPGIKLLGEDIRYIRTPVSIASEGAPLYRQAWFRWLHIVLAGLLSLAGLARLYHLLFLSNTTLYRFRKAYEWSKVALKKTEEHLAKNDIKGAGSHLANVLQDYLGAKLGIQKRSLSLKEIVERLKSRGLVGHTGEKLRNIWETLDLFQFAPAQMRPEEVRAAMQTVEHVIDEVEREILWKK
jgi:hypothetical protein